MTATAAAVRAESVRLRATAGELSFTARRQKRRLHEALAVSVSACARAREHRIVGLPSPWSDLRWIPPDAELERVLVPLDRAGR
jgi:hypothetical protein